MITKTRAQEILDSGDGFSKSYEYTPEEWQQVSEVWNTMPGWTTWLMAVSVIANGEND